MHGRALQGEHWAREHLQPCRGPCMALAGCQGAQKTLGGAMGTPGIVDCVDLFGKERPGRVAMLTTPSTAQTCAHLPHTFRQPDSVAAAARGSLGRKHGELHRQQVHAGGLGQAGKMSVRAVARSSQRTPRRRSPGGAPLPPGCPSSPLPPACSGPHLCLFCSGSSRSGQTQMTATPKRCWRRCGRTSRR